MKSLLFIAVALAVVASGDSTSTCLQATQKLQEETTIENSLVWKEACGPTLEAIKNLRVANKVILTIKVVLDVLEALVTIDPNEIPNVVISMIVDLYRLKREFSPNEAVSKPLMSKNLGDDLDFVRCFIRSLQTLCDAILAVNNTDYENQVIQVLNYSSVLADGEYGIAVCLRVI